MISYERTHGRHYVFWQQIRFNDLFDMKEENVIGFEDNLELE